ncbi:Sporulation initiation inhibitor protein Soj [Dickeya dianthicola]|uniref:ParA family protein n=1 Tax=Dickeya dianthicola TaxID=204039 RepID=UPI0003A39584|nr:AAA family ATPase [Dickeya dianthicola]AYC18401.1 Sporulation initiation inhibitor protein Soj [Dickeya dianthicola]MBI0439493.1 ParA family protein [Dickeya dianthicola]MBI0450242.1 ParA family protein [Dickeya dianthicola]MBI0454442.1 ParA family protein [Dickeya dianthicola]MBI0458616.1 ParA family protein [Dickeya dianthicola]
MSTPVLTFFNNKGGVGKTSLIYHLAWMFTNLRKRVVIADLDPQANLTAAFLDENRIEAIWNTPGSNSTIYQCIKPLTGVGDITQPHLQNIATDLYLLPGDVALSGFEDLLSSEWPNSMADNNLYRPMRILTAFWQVIQMAAEKVQADIILVDIGPNLGAINRSVLLATDYVAIPLGADLFSLQGLSNLGPTLRGWKNLWRKRLDNWQDNPESQSHPDFKLPTGKMLPIGYLCQQHGVRLDRPVKAYDKWVQRIPSVYREAVLNESPVQDMKQESDPYCLATIKHYRSLIPMAQEYRKPIFNLTSADGAIGSHANAVSDAKKDFRQLAIKIAAQIGMNI